MISLTHFLILTLAASQQASDLVDRGNASYDEGRFQEAAKLYLEAEALEKGASEVAFNLGNVYHKQLSQSDAAFKQSLSFYEKALGTESSALKSRTLFNLGTTYVFSKQGNAVLDQAIASYKEALRISPTDADTKHNLELLLRKKKAVDVERRRSDDLAKKRSAPGGGNGVGGKGAQQEARPGRGTGQEQDDGSGDVPVNPEIHTGGATGAGDHGNPGGGDHGQDPANPGGGGQGDGTPGGNPGAGGGGPGNDPTAAPNPGGQGVEGPQGKTAGDHSLDDKNPTDKKLPSITATRTGAAPVLSGGRSASNQGGSGLKPESQSVLDKAASMESQHVDGYVKEVKGEPLPSPTKIIKDW